MDRIIIDPSGIRVAKPGFDANIAAERNMAMFPGMEPMRPLYTNVVSFTGGGSQDFSFSNPTGAIPYVVLRGNDERSSGRNTYCCEMWEPYNVARIRNIDSVARTIRFFVLL